jgi:hypothetical protein
LRAVVIGTTFIIGLIMALVGEFRLIKPKPAPDRHIPATTAPPSLVGDS